MDIQIRPRPVKPRLRPLRSGKWRCWRPDSRWVCVAWEPQTAYEMFMKENQLCPQHS